MTLGVTLWRVRAATEAEDRIPDCERANEWDRQEHTVMATRISDESPVPNQDLLQMTIEYLPDRNGTGQELKPRSLSLRGQPRAIPGW